MYTGMMHTHVLAVALFLLSVVIKTIFLLLNRDNSLAKFRKKTRIPEIIVEVVMLATGVYLALNSGLVTKGIWFWVKLIAVIAAIPLAIVAFKRKVKVLAILSVLLLLYAYGLSEVKNISFDKAATLVDERTPAVEAETNAASAGSAIYQLNCVNCHGQDGEKMLSGSPKLTESQLNIEGVKDRIKNGKNSMPAYEGLLTEKQIDAVAAYVKNLRGE